MCIYDCENLEQWEENDDCQEHMMCSKCGFTYDNDNLCEHSICEDCDCPYCEDASKMLEAKMRG